MSRDLLPPRGGKVPSEKSDEVGICGAGVLGHRHPAKKKAPARIA